MPVTCGNRARHENGLPVAHATVDAVRACHRAERVWACSWLLEVQVGDPEVGYEPTVVECGGLSWLLPDDRGATCEHGHEDIYAQVRAEEGWDYAADAEEAGLLAGRGIWPVAMDGGPIDIDFGAFAYSARL